MDDPARVLQSIAGSLRASFGPFGQDQLLVSESRRLVTNSASRILEHARAGSPAGRLALEHLRRAGAALGDGSACLALLLEGAAACCAAALREGRLRRGELQLCLASLRGELLEREVRPLLADLRSASEHSAEEQVRGLALGFFGANFPPEVVRQLHAISWAWIRGNAAADGSDAPTRNSLTAAVDVLQRDELVNVPAPRVAQACESMASAAKGVASSSLERAHVFSGVLGHPNMPASVAEVRAVILDETVAPLPVSVAKPGAMFASISDLLLLAAKRLQQLGVRAVLCTAEVHEEWRGVLAQHGILMLHLIEQQELASLERVCACSRVRLASDDLELLRRSSFGVLSVKPLDALSSADLASGRSFWTLRPSSAAPPPPCWLLLRASSVGLALEYRHALLRLLRVLRPALQDPDCVIHGGLAFEIALARLAHVRANSPCSSGDEVEMGGIKDPARVRHLQRCAWQILSAALLNVIEAFIANFVACGSPQICSELGSPGVLTMPVPAVRDPKSLARWLVVATPDALGSENAGRQLGLRELPVRGQSYFGFQASPGIGDTGIITGIDAPPLFETRHLKLGLLNALCDLCGMFARIDSMCVVDPKRATYESEGS